MTHRTARLPGDRLHLQEGPSDLVIAASGPAKAVERAYAAAEARFEGLLAELASDLALLRRPLREEAPALSGDTARRMAQACRPFRAGFITPMAAVAGAVADTILAAMLEAAPDLSRAYVNNGGDIALHLAAGEALDIGVVPSLVRARPEGFLRLTADQGVRGVATSGWRGRSFSRGIADAVTVLATSAAQADAAATVIANAVDIADAAVVRQSASALDPDSDLGEIPVTVDVGPLSAGSVGQALESGRLVAEGLLRQRSIEGALLALAGEWRSVGGMAALPSQPRHGRA